MIVAGSSAPAAVARSVTVSSVTDVPSDRSAVRPGALPSAGASGFSIRHTCSTAVSLSRNPDTISSCAALSTKIALAPESLMIHSTCSAEEVSYTGTHTAPAVQMAKSRRVHSYRVRDISATRSPVPRPAATSPLASAVTSSRNSPMVTSRQPAALPSGRRSATCCGLSVARWDTMPARLAELGISTRAGMLCWRTTLSPSPVPALADATDRIA
jgi:hypothetical protein